MAITKKASAHWEGDLKTGIGSISTETGVLREAPYGFKARFEGGKGTNPEELIGAAHAGCFSMAFSMILGKRIIVPPHNGIIGAIGMALIAQEVMGAKQQARGHGRTLNAAADALPSAQVPAPPTQPVSTFRGFDLNTTSFRTREFVCKACSNFCDMKEITVDGRKTYWGDKCSDKFRKRARTNRQAVIEDLVSLRDGLLRQGYRDPQPGQYSGKPRVGVPQAMYYYDRFPFWRTYLEGIGFEIVVSGATDHTIATRGAEVSLAEPCFPLQIAHGHIHALLNGAPERPAVDFVLVPNVVDMEAPESPIASHLCPWNQTLPFVIRSAPEFEKHANLLLSPTIHFRAGRRHVQKELASYFRHFGVSDRDSDRAAESAYRAQAKFTAQLLHEGGRAWMSLRTEGQPCVLLVGRAYNMYDRASNCDIPRKLRELYGVNVLPMDFLSLDDQPSDDLHANMFWNSGRRILAAGRFARNHPNMHIIYITNFKCGPDSFIKHFLRDVALSPFLILQFDGHGNDAGYLTRCEAYLDSKGILRCSSKNNAQVA